MSHQFKKIKRYAISWSKEKEKPTVNSCNATITESAQYKVEPITKIKLQVGPILLKFHLTGSSGNLVPTIYIYIYIYIYIIFHLNMFD